MAAYRIINKTRSAVVQATALHFPLNRTSTTNSLQFDTLHFNSVYAQMSRWQSRKITAMALSYHAATVGKLAMDCCRGPGDF